MCFCQTKFWLNWVGINIFLYSLKYAKIIIKNDKNFNLVKLVVTQLLTTNIAIDQMDCLVVDNLSIPWGKNYYVICVFPPWVLTIISIKCIKLWMIVLCQYCSNCLICAMKYIMHNCRVQYLAFLAPKLHNTHVVLTKARMPRNLFF